VPVPLVRRFLKDVGDGRYDGVPTVGLSWQTLGNDRMKAFYKMGARTGVVVNDIDFGSPAWGKIAPGDVLLAVDGVTIADDATYVFAPGKRMLFTHLLSGYQTGQVVRFDVLRDGVPRSVQMAVAPVDGALVRGPLYDTRPSYFVYGGLVFTPITRNYLDTFGQNDLSAAFRHLQEYGRQSAERREAIVLAFVLPDEVNGGYHDYRGIVVDAINGRRLSRMADVIEAFKHPKDGFQVVTFDPVSDGGRLVMDAAEAEKSGPRILERHHIPSDRSDDLKPAAEKPASADAR
jgi:hypothetical protein